MLEAHRTANFSSGKGTDHVFFLADCRREIGVAPRAISDEEIVERRLYAMENEAALILEEGIALRAFDIDAILVKLAAEGKTFN